MNASIKTPGSDDATSANNALFTKVRLYSDAFSPDLVASDNGSGESRYLYANHHAPARCYGR